MSALGKWPIVLEHGWATGAFAGGGDYDAVGFDWNGSNEMDNACRIGSAEPQPDRSLSGEIRFHGDDEISFIAPQWTNSSTAC